MFNHFCMFSDEATARSVLAAYVTNDLWDAGCVIPGQRVVLQRGTWKQQDGAIVPDQPEVTVPGFFVTVSLPSIDAALRDMPGHACRLIGDARTGALVYTAPDLDPGMLATALIEPVPAGSSYSFAI